MKACISSTREWLTYLADFPLNGCSPSSQLRMSSAATKRFSRIICSVGNLPPGAAAELVHTRPLAFTPRRRRRS